MKTKTRKTNLPLFDMRAGFVPSTFNKEKRTVDVIFSTGAKVLRSPWFGEPYYEELEISKSAMRMDRLNGGAPLLNNHSNWSLEDVIGVVERAWVDGEKAMATVRLSEREDIAGIVKDIETGIIRNISVGYRVHKFEKQNAPEGAAPTPDETPVYRAVDWEPMELSFVGIPADAGAQARGSDGALQLREGTQTNECVLVNNNEREESMGKKNKDGQRSDDVSTETPASPSTETPAQAEGSTPTEGAAPASTPAAGAEGEEQERGAQPQTQTPEQIQAAEVTRQAEIRKAVRTARLEESFADELVKDTKMTIEGARAAIFAKMEETSNQVRTNNNVRVEGAGMETLIARREAATRVLLHQFDRSAFALKDGDGEMQAHGLLGMARKILTMEGVRGAYDMTPRELSERALHHSSDFPKVLENLANKTLQKGYEQAPNTFMPFVSEKSVADFKEISSVRLSDGGTLKKVNEHGEFKRGSLVETGEKYAVDTYGLIIGATRKLLMNDDLGAFTKIPTSLGMRAKQKENELFWAIVISNPVMAETGQALFSAPHANTQAQAAIAIASLGTGRAKMRALLDMDKQPINLSPSYIVVPSALETLAEQYVAQVTPNASAQVNPFGPSGRSRLDIVVEPRLDAAPTVWYLFADKSKIDMVELARIDGQGPKISVREGFDIDGMETKISYDFGMKALDYRGFFKTLA